ncbi:unnamed protein product, partial [Dovyalis caffra]
PWELRKQVRGFARKVLLRVGTECSTGLRQLVAKIFNINNISIATGSELYLRNMKQVDSYLHSAYPKTVELVRKATKIQLENLPQSK